MRFVYVPTGICPTEIAFDIDDSNVISNIHFENGCEGNLKILSKLLDGKTVDEIVSVGRYNTCDLNPTSCADQLALAVQEAASVNQKGKKSPD